MVIFKNTNDFNLIIVSFCEVTVQFVLEQFTLSLLTVGPHFLGIQLVRGISIYTPKELDVANGTSVKLKCTFSTTHPVTAQSVTVSWNFRPLNSALEESVSSRKNKDPFASLWIWLLPVELFTDALE